ncbi:uncharacterized protein [Leptinotarsa decemlineata]|uniref:uncharacterized protein n=1 Tax=Leptinotarsa decemlineata TaxID=7539 RepID=UPI003D30AC00
MARKMQINRLDRDELCYELTVRGVAVGTVDEMRHRLSVALQMEKDGDSLRYPDYPFIFSDDETAVKTALDELTVLLTNFDGQRNSGEGLKFQTKLSYVLGRIDRMEPKDCTEKTTKADLVAQALILMDEFNQKIHNAQQASRTVPSGLSQLQNRIINQALNANIQPVAHSSLAAVTFPNQVASDGKMIPPYKWNIKKFTGDAKGVSVTAFFEMIEEHRLARHVPESILLDSGMDLFAEKAYQFYKDCRGRVDSWEELVGEFRDEYLSANHMDALFEELQRRTQHPTESIGVYLAVMSNYFSRLGCPMSEDAKLAIIMKNLHPFYQDRLRDPLPTNISELRDTCRKMESRRDVINSYVEPSTRRGNIIEKDLAFVDLAENMCAMNVATTQPATSGQRSCQVICFRCKQPGHRAVGCASAGKRQCYGCNREGFTKRNCPNCSNKGNGHGHS